VIAQVNPVTEITALAHAAGAFVCVDGVSYAPHGLPNVGDMGPDIYLFSSYKTYGPHQGIMVIRRALGELLPNQGHYFNAGSLYKRFTPAGPDHAQIAACAGIIDYFEALADHHGMQGTATERCSQVHDLMRAHESALLQPLLDFVASKNSVRMLGSRVASERAPTVALDLGKSPVEAAKSLAERGIMADGNDFYAVRPLQASGIDPEQGVLRLSFVHYTSQAEVDKLMTVLEDIL
jgi:selenocysteine lyase/cysteine desulfurase